MRKYKIVFIIDSLLVAGAQRQLLRLANELIKCDFNLEIVCLGGVDESFVGRDSLIKIRKVSMESIRNPSFWKGFFVLISVLRKHKPNIVHTYLNTANVFGAIAAKIAGVPVIVTSRRDMGLFKSVRIGFLERMINRFAARIICVSNAVKDKTIQTEKYANGKVAVIYNGVDPSIFQREGRIIENGKYFNVGIVAAINRETKGHRYFIEAGESILQKRRDVRFIIVGDGPLKRDLAKRVKDKGLEEYFIFKNGQDDISIELKRMDIFVMPSLSEGFSNAVLEAMSMEIPVIATAVEGNLEMIEDGVSGCLVKPADPDAIAEKVSYLLENPDKAKEIGAKARERVLERFTLDEMVGNYISLYKSLVEKKKIGYAVSLFPCWSEVFILNEISELVKKDVDITIFSIRKDLENFTQEKARPFLKNTKYVAMPGLIRSTLVWLIKKPFTFISIFFLIISNRYNNFEKLAKDLWSMFAGYYFADIARKEHISHIHAHFATYPALTAMTVSKLTGIPFTFTAHAHDIFLDKKLLLEKSINAKDIIAISDFNRKYITDHCKNGVASKIKVVHCGIDLNEFAFSHEKTETGENVIIGIGRLSKMKGFDYLVKACGLIKARIPFKCYIIGEGPMRNELEGLIGTLGLDKQVILTGVLDSSQIKNMLGKATVFSLPSIWDDEDGQDGIPVVLMEAMAMGIPVVSTRISGIPELIEDGKAGFLVEPKNVKELADKLYSIITDKTLREKFSANGRRKVEQGFDINKNAASLLEVFTR